MRRLNIKVGTNLPCFQNDQPELVLQDVWGTKIALDPNSLAAILLENKGEFDELKTQPLDPHIMAKYMPNVPLTRPLGFRRLGLRLTTARNISPNYLVPLDGEPEVMEFSTAQMVLDRHFNSSVTTDLALIGGDPLLEWDLLLQVWAYVLAKSPPGRKVQFTVITDAADLRPKRVVWLSDQKFQLVVRLDGTGLTYEPPALERIMTGLKLLRIDSMPQRIMLASTFTSAVLDIPEDSLATRLEVLNQLCDDGYAQQISLASLDHTEYLAGLPVEEHRLSHEQVGLLDTRFHAIAKWYVDRVQRGKIVRYKELNEGIVRFLFCQHRCSVCDAGLGTLTVNPDDSLYPCDRPDVRSIGSLRGGGIDEAERRQWTDNRFYTRKQCGTCSLRWWCGGGCRCLFGKGPEWAQIDCGLSHSLAKTALWIMSHVSANELLRSVPEVKAIHQVSTQQGGGQ